MYLVAIFAKKVSTLTDITRYDINGQACLTSLRREPRVGFLSSSDHLKIKKAIIEQSKSERNEYMYLELGSTPIITR